MNSNFVCRRLFSIVCGLLLIGSAGRVDIVEAQPASGGDTTTGSLWLRAGGGHSDNLLRTDLLPESGSYTAFGMQSDLGYTSARLDASFDADIERRLYSLSGVEDETYGYADLSLDIAVVPERFIWIIGDRFTQGRSDPLEVSSPENRSEVNVFTTGPRFTIPLGARSTLQLDALESVHSVSDDFGLDGDSSTRSLSYVRALDQITRLSVTALTRTVEYDTNPTAYDIETVYVSYDKTLATGSARIALGSTQSEFGANSNSTPYVDLAWSRDVGSRSRLELNLSQQFSEYFDEYQFSVYTDAILTPDIYEQQLLAVSYAITGQRSSISFGFAQSSADYTTASAFDYDETSFSIDYSRQLTAAWTLGLAYYLNEREFAGAASSDDWDRQRVSLVRNVGRRISFEASYETGSADAISGSGVDEDVFRFFFRYAAAGAAARGAQ
jgi:hypothetical protein